MTQPIHLVIPPTRDFPFEIAMHLTWATGQPEVRSLSVRATGTEHVTGEVLRKVAVKRLMHQALLKEQPPRREAAGT